MSVAVVDEAIYVDVSGSGNQSAHVTANVGVQLMLQLSWQNAVNLLVGSWMPLDTSSLGEFLVQKGKPVSTWLAKAGDDGQQLKWRVLSPEVARHNNMILYPKDEQKKWPFEKGIVVALLSVSKLTPNRAQARVVVAQASTEAQAKVLKQYFDDVCAQLSLQPATLTLPELERVRNTLAVRALLGRKPALERPASFARMLRIYAQCLSDQLPFEKQRLIQSAVSTLLRMQQATKQQQTTATATAKVNDNKKKEKIKKSSKPTSSSQQQQAENATLHAKVTALEAKLADLQTRYDDKLASSSTTSTTTTSTSNDAECAALREQCAQLKSQLAAATLMITTLQQQSSLSSSPSMAINADMQGMQAQLQQRLRASDPQQQQSSLVVSRNINNINDDDDDNDDDKEKEEEEEDDDIELVNFFFNVRASNEQADGDKTIAALQNTSAVTTTAATSASK